MWRAMTAKDSFRRSADHAKSAHKIMELVGRFTAEDQWSAACALVCYRASEKLQSELFSEQSNILDELYPRITTTRHEEDALHDVMTFWVKLNEYRKWECRHMLHSNEEHSVTPYQASRMIENFKIVLADTVVNFEECIDDVSVMVEHVGIEQLGQLEILD